MNGSQRYEVMLHSCTYRLPYQEKPTTTSSTNCHSNYTDQPLNSKFKYTTVTLVIVLRWDYIWELFNQLTLNLRVNYLMSGEKSSEQAYPATMWPLKVFLRFSLKRFRAEKITILLSILWQASHLWLGEGVTAGMECILGSAMYFISTGISLHTTFNR